MSMVRQQIDPETHQPPRHPEDFWALARQIARLGTQGADRISFLQSVSSALLEFSHSDLLELWATDPDQDYRWQCARPEPQRTRFEPVPPNQALAQKIAALVNHFAGHHTHSEHPHSAILAHDDRTRDGLREAARAAHADAWLEQNCWPCILLLPLEIDSPYSGLLILKSRCPEAIPSSDVSLYSQVAAGLGRAIANRRAQFRLRERIKELTCLHGIAQVAQKHPDDLSAAIQEVVDLLPAAMQFPSIAAVRLRLDDKCLSTPGAAQIRRRLAVPLVIAGAERGRVEVGYVEEHLEFVAGTFLPEEMNLLESAARDVSLIVERAEADAARIALADQLRHADRLATIGQLAAGIAHELNEPLANILGFAQLMEKDPALSATALRDTSHIVHAVLHAREIVRKLLIFARQTRAQQFEVDLNALVRDSIYFLDARCRRSGIDLKLELAPATPIILADPSQMTQVVVNLVVNAIQAMPQGGNLTVATRRDSLHAWLTVSDTGIGMDEHTRQRLFTPFFTTKDVGEGTGLGLSVVHGIVSAHAGTISVVSAPAKGSRFEVRLPLAPTGADLKPAGEP